VQIKIKAILFDMDGTLVNSHSIVINAWQQFANMYNLDLNKILAVSHGMPSIDTIKLFANNDMDIKKEVKLIDDFNLISSGEIPISGAIEFLQKIPPNKWAIVTSASYNLAIKRLTTAKIQPPELLIAEDHVSHGKPNPEGYLKAVKLLGVETHECLIFEDSSVGVMAANNANIPVVIIGNNHQALQLPHLLSIQNFDNVQININKDYINLSI
jgi:mannitol-1-/sugar-/sorbitol-6-phosphatase